MSPLPSPLPNPLPGQLLPQVMALAEQAGRMITAEATRPGGPRGTGAHAPVDGAIEVLLRTALLTLLPAAWRGEETGAAPGPDNGFCWLVDPQDGTSAFLTGQRGSAVSIALLHEGRPLLGVVHAPLPPDRGPDTIAWAEGLDHLIRDGAPWPHRLDRARLGAGDVVLMAPAAARFPLGNGRALHPARFVAQPSIAYRLARVAAGDAAAAASIIPTSGWDYAAGHALLLGAGGALLNEAGRPVTYTQTGESQAGRCFGGAQGVARDLSNRNWNAVAGGRPLQPRTSLAWPPRGWDVALDRALGCLFGQVAGDSLGSLVEFKSPAEIVRHHPDGLRDLADGGTWSTMAGQPTDDSELALDLARILAGRPAWSAEAVAAAYAGWHASRPFDIGGTTAQALSAAAAAPEGRVAAAARRAANAYSRANGALMRCAPIGLWARHAREAAEAAREDARLTHPNPMCQAASAGFVAAIATALTGGDAAAMLEAAEAELQRDAPDELRIALALARQGEGPANFIHQQGYVLIAFQNAFRHLAQATPLEEAVVRTVAEGGDTDTNAAICGALLGAAQGSAAVPMRWRMAIQSCRPMEELGALQPRPPRYWPDDLPALAEALLRRD
ncbi:ADP-ribosylglycohydrolase family protein [Roseococcus sp. SDR]|uniref:inositol monophosphatase family protein n=1 Tax=Roseococcus sp. SDR TaxID=2835532 RepID=UPI001BCB49C1|nr:inositol monophosphatase family protein [Roseococcus sp. SDR]MBS7793066.1 ADP-ribosylglycohydrolase family protein [Roseococcus sp. SDR]MBV1848380.1 ADP-ribosylglycohydrolase family protein [Roseococcus sp. SDR]